METVRDPNGEFLGQLSLSIEDFLRMSYLPKIHLPYN